MKQQTTTALTSCLVCCLLSVQALLTEAGWVKPPHSTTQGLEEWDTNPILKPHFPNWLLGDPTLVQVNNVLHLWINTALTGISHFTAPLHSPENMTFQDMAVSSPGAVRPYATSDGSTIWLYYEQYDVKTAFQSSALWLVACNNVSGQRNTSVSATLVLEPTERWERQGQARVGNPYVYQHVDGVWHMYYSSSAVYLPDAHLHEPHFLGWAQAASPRGPWTNKTLVTIDQDYKQVNQYNKHDNGYIKHSSNATALATQQRLGIGSLKRTPDGGGLCNTLFFDDKTNTTSSVIQRLASYTPTHWVVTDATFLSPTGDETNFNGKYVYGFDLWQNPSLDNWLIYYNARNRPRHGKEALGLCRFRPSASATANLSRSHKTTHPP